MSAHRDTIFVEDTEILQHDAHPGEQYLLRLHAPECTRLAQPGMFVHLQCSPQRPMRRPLSIMRASPNQGVIELLYKVVGDGSRELAQQPVGSRLSSLGPIGQPFRPEPTRPYKLLVGGGVGIPPMVFLAEHLSRDAQASPLVVMGSEAPFPFQPRPSRFMVPGMPPGTIAAMPLLDDWGIPSRLASGPHQPGCHQGLVTDLAEGWLANLDEPARAQAEIFTCGPHPMMEAVARLAHCYDIPCQAALEEFMACGVGGCAGCTVEVRTPEGPAMKRVCVDGPVFDAHQVFF